MKKLILPLLLLTGLSLSAEEASAPLVSLDVAADREPELAAVLEGQGIAVISWSNALVEVSAFGPLETIPLARLSASLTSADPRWDPWLTGIRSYFRPTAQVARLWVDPSAKDRARTIAGDALVGTVAVRAKAAPVGGFEPRQVTGWMLIAAGLLYLALRLVADLTAASGWRPWSRWLWVPVPLAATLLGLVLAFWGGGSLRVLESGVPARAEVSWLRHRWFQESWAYGATWKDWSEGKPWNYTSYEHKAGKVEAVSVTMPVPDAAWASAAFSALDPRHAARIFGPENP